MAKKIIRKLDRENPATYIALILLIKLYKVRLFFVKAKVAVKSTPETFLATKGFLLLFMMFLCNSLIAR